MSMEYLGDQIDIHGGGIDLKFPHHEAEIAQSEGATGKIPFVRYWLHTGTVHYLGKKMSKSEGNLELVSDILKKYSPNAIRWLLLSHHFSKSWEYEEKDLIQAQKNVNLVENAIKYANELTNNDHAINTFTQILDQNLDTPKALDFLLKMTKRSAKGLENLYTSLGFSLKKSKL